MNFWSYIKKNFKIVIILSMFAIITNAFRLVSPYLLQQIVENYKGIKYNLVLFGMVILVVYLGQILYEYFNKKYSVLFKTNESLNLSELIYKMKYSSIEEYEPTYLVNRLDEAVNNLYNFISKNITDIISGFLSIIIIIFFIFQYSNYLAFLYIIYTLISFVGYKILNKSLMKKSIKLQDVVSINYKNILCFLTNIDFMKLAPSFHNIGIYLKKFFGGAAEENAKAGFFASGVGIVLDFLLEILQNLIYILVFYFAFAGKIRYSQVAAIILLNSYFKSSMQVLNSTNIGLRDVRASLDYINNILNKNREKSGGNELLDEINNFKIEIQNVAYGKNILIKSGMVYAEKGEIIGLVGESGVGKSTLIKILLGFKEDSECKVYFNGINSFYISNKSIKEKIGYISQNQSVFPISIKENFFLEIDKENIPDENQDYQSLLEKKGFEKFKNIAQETIILEGASNLSGGDRQKIIIGRMLLKSPQLLVLDEFSNSIDAETEEYIIELLKEKYKEKIIILITHNKELLKWCNRIYEIREKKLEETVITTM